MLWPLQPDQVGTIHKTFMQIMYMCVLTDISYVPTAARRPTYGELIDLYKETECECPDNEELLCSNFRKFYPKIYVGRPRRFYETVVRIVAPTRPSLRGESRLSGSPLSSYRRRRWEPRVRNLAAIG